MGQPTVSVHEGDAALYDTAGTHLTALHPDEVQRGSDPGALRDELTHVVREWLARRPRSLQQSIGPSQLGVECSRQIGHRLAGSTGRRPGGGWLPGIGTAVHTMLQTVFDDWNAATGFDRYATEVALTCGEVGGVALTGTADLYDRVTATITDWKVVGTKTLDTARRKGPTAQYRTQAHIYGRGVELAGLPIDTVSIAYLPRNYELTSTVFWHEPYDRDVALTAIARADGIATALNALSPEVVLPQLDRRDDCRFCDYFTPEAGDDDVSCCPGAPGRPLDVAVDLVRPRR